MFVCDLCGRTFPPNPDAMIETEVEEVELPEYLAEEMLRNGEAFDENDPGVQMARAGAMCICRQCQDEAEQEDDDGDF